MCKVFVTNFSTTIVGAGLRGMPKGIHTVDLVPARCPTGQGMAGHRDPALQWGKGFPLELTPMVTKTLHTRQRYSLGILYNQ